MQIFLWMTFPLFCMVFMGCQRPGTGIPGQPEPTEEQQTGDPMGESGGVTAAGAATALNGFAFRLYHLLAKPGQNAFFSPVSLYSALAMTAAGAQGETFEEMRAVLLEPEPEKTEDVESLTSSARRLTESILESSLGGEVVLDVANALWVQQGFPIRDSFVALLDRQFDAAAREVDFAGELDQSREKINRWTAERTSGRIDPLLPRGSLDRNTRLVLTNAVYFLGSWQDPFDERATRTGEFRRADGMTVEAPFMNRTGSYLVAQSADGTWLELPYRGGRLGLVVGLPAQGTTLESFSAGLSPRNLMERLAGLREMRIDLAIPKFRFDKNEPLAGPLKQMGMARAFEPGGAQFGGISASADLFVQEVFHGAFVEVNERGTEAAAATGISVGVTSMPPEIRVDRPFLFLIRDRETGAILFLGQLADPTA